MKGYSEKILVINLKTKEVSSIGIEEETLRRFIGGSGLAAYLFLKRVPVDVDPLSKENTLFIMTGPLTGTNLQGTSRFSVCAKSPLTGIWGEASCGGNFGSELKFAGIDGIIIEDVSDNPVYISIDDDRVEILDASSLWGKDTYETDDILGEKGEGKRGPRVLCIGQAGENLVKYASIVNNKGHVIGRCGLGAVMGFKKLKAVVVRGTKKVEVAMPDEYKEVRKRANEKIKEAVPAKALQSMGTDSAMFLGMMTGDIPIKNWTVGQDFKLSEGLGGPTMNDKYLTRNHSCFACTIGCKRVVKVDDGPYKTEEGPGPEYETCCTFGTMIVNSNLAGVIKANELCNRYGLDTISCGSTIAFATECFDRGILSRDDTGGIDLEWGDIDAAIEIVHKIAKRDGFGDILAEGSREAARRIGKGSEEFSVEVKGLELPMHDPRGYHGMGLAYMTSSRGACHLQHLNLPVEQGMATYPEVGLKENYEGRTSDGKAEMTYISENLGILCGSVAICIFVNYCISANDLVDMLKTTTGLDYTLEEILECGERLWYLKRGLVNLMGVTSKDDRLPKRVLTPVEDGPAKGSRPDVELMLKEYYRLRRLNQNGVPEKERLLKLGLDELAGRLYPVKE